MAAKGPHESNPSPFVPPPFRPIDEFAGSNGRFEVPPIQNMESWTNKVLGNLLYFQTNYAVILLATFLPLGIFYTSDFVLSLISFGLILGGLKFAETSQAIVQTLTRNHPLLFLIVSFAGGYLIVVYVGNLAVYICGLVVPVLIVFFHASFRSRNVRGKTLSPQEKAAAIASPMGLALKQLGESFDQLTTMN